MNHTQPANGELAALWNGPSGRAWVDMQAVLDRMFEPLEELLVEAAFAPGANAFTPTSSARTRRRTRSATRAST